MPPEKIILTRDETHVIKNDGGKAMTQRSYLDEHALCVPVRASLILNLNVDYRKLNHRRTTLDRCSVVYVLSILRVYQPIFSLCDHYVCGVCLSETLFYVLRLSILSGFRLSVYPWIFQGGSSPSSDRLVNLRTWYVLRNKRDQNQLIL